jgi:hypothetical protein
MHLGLSQIDLQYRSIRYRQGLSQATVLQHPCLVFLQLAGDYHPYHRSYDMTMREHDCMAVTLL